MKHTHRPRRWSNPETEGRPEKLEERELEKGEEEKPQPEAQSGEAAPSAEGEAVAQPKKRRGRKPKSLVEAEKAVHKSKAI